MGRALPRNQRIAALSSSERATAPGAMSRADGFVLDGGTGGQASGARTADTADTAENDKNRGAGDHGADSS
jgi:hypothetical protein